MKKTIYLIISILLVASCVYPFEPEGVVSQPRLVFEGDIVLGEVFSITVRSTHPINPDDTEGFIGVQTGRARVESSKGAIYPGINWSSGGDGLRFSFDLTGADPDAEYRLHFHEEGGDGKDYYSRWQEVMAAPEVTDLEFDYDDEKVHIRVDAGSSTSSYFKWDYTEDWQFHAEYIPHNWFNVPSRSVMPYEGGYDDSLYWCWNHASSVESGLASTGSLKENRLDGHLVVSFDRSNIRFQWRYRMDITMRNLGKEAYDYLRNMNEISDISGDLFSPNPNDMRGNMVCVQDSSEFVIGYISAVQLARKRMYIASDENTFYKAPSSTELFLPEVSQSRGLLDYFNADFRPVMDIPVDMGTAVGWGPLRCIDCRASGGTKLRPSDWPEDPDKDKNPAI